MTFISMVLFYQKISLHKMSVGKYHEQRSEPVKLLRTS